MSTTWKMPEAPPPLPSPVASRRRAQSSDAQLPEKARSLRQLQSTGISLVVHSVLLLILALFSAGTAGRSGANIVVQSVVMTAEAGAETSQGVFVEDTGASMLGSDDSSGGDSTLGGDASQSAAGLPGADAAPIAVESTIAAGAGGDNGLSDVGDAAGGLGLGAGGSKLGGSGSLPQAKTTVFGIEGTGRRFVYIFDRSSSMNGYTGLPMATAKSELIKSLQGLGRVHQFQLIFYNDQPLAYGQLGGSSAMLSATDENKLSAISYVKRMKADGGTEHLTALRMGLSMNVDVIFFLTDAEEPGMSGRDLRDLVERASRIGTVIHTIQFGTGANQNAGSWIAELARECGGKYRYIDVTTFAPSS